MLEMNGLPCANFSAASRFASYESGNGVGSERKVLGSALRDLAAIARIPHIDGMRLGCLKPFAPGGHDFRGGFFKSVMQQHKLLHARLLFTDGGKCFLFGVFAFGAIASAYCNERLIQGARLRASASNFLGQSHISRIGRPLMGSKVRSPNSALNRARSSPIAE